MKNAYEIRGEVTAIFIQSEKYGNMETLVSTSSLEKVMSFPNGWHVKLDKKNGNFYVYGRLTINKKQRDYSLHRWITDADKGKEVDHFNHNTLDNTDNNLRVVTVSENQHNRTSATRKSKSGIRGVYWHKSSKKWVAQIKINRKKIEVGYFDDVNQAAEAIREARKNYAIKSFDIVS